MKDSMDQIEFHIYKSQFIEKQRQCIQQSIFSLSHTIRGPLATALGIFHIIDYSNLSESNVLAMEMLKMKMEEVDKHIKDLIMSQQDQINMLG